MERKFQSLFLPLALLLVFHFLHSPPAFADTDGSDIQIISPSYLEVQLGPAFAGTKLRKTRSVRCFISAPAILSVMPMCGPIR